MDPFPSAIYKHGNPPPFPLPTIPATTLSYTNPTLHTTHQSKHRGLASYTAHDMILQP